jgi:hypothetical protein
VKERRGDACEEEYDGKRTKMVRGEIGPMTEEEDNNNKNTGVCITKCGEEVKRGTWGRDGISRKERTRKMYV